MTGTQHHFCAIPTKDENLNLIMRKYQIPTKGRISTKDLACNLQRYQGHES